MGTMLILRGISGTFAGKTYRRGALDEESALRYADRRGYRGKVLDVSGETGPKSNQVHGALDEILNRPGFANPRDYNALYGFSGGGYNLYWILRELTPAQRAHLKLVVVIGAPGRPRKDFAALLGEGTELVYRSDPPGGHMDGPRALLGECECATH